MDERKKFAAVLPAGKFFDGLYRSVLLPWSEARGAELARVNLEAAAVAPICTALEQADLVLADISGRHPRVLYAAGYAHGIGRRVWFLTQFADDFPFALTNQQVLVYSGNFDCLRDELQAAAGGGAGRPAATGPREKFLALFGDILERHAHEHRGGVEMENPSTFVLVDQDMGLALVQDLSRKARQLGLRLKLM